MEITVALSLPRDAISVPIVRRVLRTSMQSLGVREECSSDLELALTEACTNVLDHVHSNDEYDVVCTLSDSTCVIDVIDTGGGFDASELGAQNAAGSAESGRGIQLIRALVDSVHFSPSATQGTVVHLEKKLELVEGSPIQVLAATVGR